MPIDFIATLIAGTGMAALTNSVMVMMHDRQMDKVMKNAALNKKKTLQDMIDNPPQLKQASISTYVNCEYNKYLIEEAEKVAGKAKKEATESRLAADKAREVADIAGANAKLYIDSAKESEKQKKGLEHKLKAVEKSMISLQNELNSLKESGNKEFKANCRSGSSDSISDDGSMDCLSPSTGKKDLFSLFSSSRKLSSRENSPLLKSKPNPDFEGSSSAPSSPKGSFSLFGRRKSTDSEYETYSASPTHGRRGSLDTSKEEKVKSQSLNLDLMSISESPADGFSSPITIERNPKKSGSTSATFKDSSKHKESTSLSPEPEKKGGSLLSLFKSSETSKHKKDSEGLQSFSPKVLKIDLEDFSLDSDHITTPLSPKTAKNSLSSKEKFSFFTKKHHHKFSSIDKDTENPVSPSLENKSNKPANVSDKKLKSTSSSSAVADQELPNISIIAKEQAKLDDAQNQSLVESDVLAKLSNYLDTLPPEELNTLPNSVESVSMFLPALPNLPSFDVNLGGMNINPTT
ncbi:MAG: hypothetical protein ACRYE9_05630 [Janthinobacterium lividum]